MFSHLKNKIIRLKELVEFLQIGDWNIFETIYRAFVKYDFNCNFAELFEFVQYMHNKRSTVVLWFSFSLKGSWGQLSILGSLHLEQLHFLENPPIRKHFDITEN